MSTAYDPPEKERRVWHVLTNVRRIEGDKLTAEAVVPVQSPWFAGHFPNEPILPGVAQIALVRETIQRAYGKDLIVESLKRIRFKQTIEPDDPIQIVIDAKSGSPGTFDFKIWVREEVAASGSMVMTQTA